MGKGKAGKRRQTIKVGIGADEEERNQALSQVSQCCSTPAEHAWCRLRKNFQGLRKRHSHLVLHPLTIFVRRLSVGALPGDLPIDHNVQVTIIPGIRLHRQCPVECIPGLDNTNDPSRQHGQDFEARHRRVKRRLSPQQRLCRSCRRLSASSLKESRRDISSSARRFGFWNCGNRSLTRVAGMWTGAEAQWLVGSPEGHVEPADERVDVWAERAKTL